MAEEPFREFIEWWDDPKVQEALRGESDYTKAKSAFYAAFARLEGGLVPPQAHRGQQFPSPDFRGMPAGPERTRAKNDAFAAVYGGGPPPVTRIDRYDFIAGGDFEGASEPGLTYTPTDKQPALRDQYPPTTTMKRLPDDTNPGFPVIAFDPEPGHEG